MPVPSPVCPTLPSLPVLQSCLPPPVFLLTCFHQPQDLCTGLPGIFPSPSLHCCPEDQRASTFFTYSSSVSQGQNHLEIPVFGQGSHHPPLPTMTFRGEAVCLCSLVPAKEKGKVFQESREAACMGCILCAERTLLTPPHLPFAWVKPQLLREVISTRLKPKAVGRQSLAAL